MQFRLRRAEAFVSSPIHLLSQRSQKRGLYAIMPSVCPSVVNEICEVIRQAAAPGGIFREFEFYEF